MEQMNMMELSCVLISASKHFFLKKAKKYALDFFILIFEFEIFLNIRNRNTVSFLRNLSSNNIGYLKRY